MRHIKSINRIVIFLMIIISISSCAPYEYDGKEISTIIYESIDYMGGYVNETKIDLINGEVLSKAYFPIDEDNETYTIDHQFETNKVDEFLNDAGASGLFELDEHYPSPGGILDGGGWILTINYKDGTNKTSTGSNNYPRKIFERSDYAFFNLYGDDLFQTLPSAYKNPPSIDIAFNHSVGQSTYSDGFGLSAINYIWHQKSVFDDDVVEYAKANQEIDFNSDYAYSFVLWTANYDHRFSNVKITSYDLDGENPIEIDETGWFKQKTYPIEFNRVYVITMRFDYGTCIYAFSSTST